MAVGEVGPAKPATLGAHAARKPGIESTAVPRRAPWRKSRRLGGTLDGIWGSGGRGAYTGDGPRELTLRLVLLPPLVGACAARPLNNDAAKIGTTVVKSQGSIASCLELALLANPE